MRNEKKKPTKEKKSKKKRWGTRGISEKREEESKQKKIFVTVSDKKQDEGARSLLVHVHVANVSRRLIHFFNFGPNLGWVSGRPYKSTIMWKIAWRVV